MAKRFLYHTGDHVRLANGRICLSFDDFSQRWEAACKDLGIPEDTWYDLPEDQAKRIVKAVVGHIIEEVEAQPVKRKSFLEDTWKWIILFLALEQVRELAASDLYDAAKSGVRQTFVNRIVASAMQKRKRGEYDASVAELSSAIRIDSENHRLYHDRGLTYLDWGRYREAFDDFSRALELNPRYYSAYNNRGNVLHQLGQYQRAIEDYNKAIELNPADGVAFHNRGHSLLSLGRAREALTDFERAIQLDSSYLTPVLSMCRTYVDLREWRTALEYCDDYLERDRSPNALAFVMRGIAHEHLGRQRDALQDFESALELVRGLPDTSSAIAKSNYREAEELAREHLIALGVR